jgi:Resolvase, N terminal domain
MTRKGKLVQAVAYMRTSSATNVGADKDSEARQRRVIASYAKRAGLMLVDEFCDPAVSGADPIEIRPGFSALKLRVAREAKRAATGKCEGRKSYAERDPSLVPAAKELSAQRPRLSLRKISAALAERGFVMGNGKPYPAMSVSNMLAA